MSDQYWKEGEDTTGESSSALWIEKSWGSLKKNKNKPWKVMLKHGLLRTF